MITETHIANLALSHIGATPVASAEQSPEIQLHFDQCVRELLRAHPWNFATTTKELPIAQDSPHSVDEWPHAYDLPADCVRPLFYRNQGYATGQTEHEVRGQFVLSYHDSLSLTYVSDKTELADYPPDVVHALTMLLASRLAANILKQPQLASQLYDAYKRDCLIDAKRNDVAESPRSLFPGGVDPQHASPAIAARRGGRHSHHPRYRDVVAPPDA